MPTRVLAKTARFVREVQAAGIDVSTLAGVKFAYPTYSAVIGMAARALLTEPAR